MSEMRPNGGSREKGALSGGLSHPCCLEESRAKTCHLPGLTSVLALPVPGLFSWAPELCDLTVDAP